MRVGVLPRESCQRRVLLCPRCGHCSAGAGPSLQWTQIWGLLGVCHVQMGRGLGASSWSPWGHSTSGLEKQGRKWGVGRSRDLGLGHRGQGSAQASVSRIGLGVL